MKPIRPQMSKSTAETFLKGVSNIGMSIKNYGRNVVGGAKIVGSAIRNKLRK